MATKIELEKNPSFRFSKVVFMLIAGVAVILTFTIWFTIKEKKLDASNAYFTCNDLGADSHSLTDSEKKLLQDTRLYFFQKGTPENIKLSKECYKAYSGGKNPDLATDFDIQLFHEMQKGGDDKVYAVGGVREYTDWHFNSLALVLFIEYIIF